MIFITKKRIKGSGSKERKGKESQLERQYVKQWRRKQKGREETIGKKGREVMIWEEKRRRREGIREENRGHLSNLY